MHRTKFNKEWTFSVTVVWWNNSFFDFYYTSWSWKASFHWKLVEKCLWLDVFVQLCSVALNVAFCRCRVGNWIRAGRPGAVGTLQDRWYMRQLLWASFSLRECLYSQIFWKCLFCDLCMAPAVWWHSHQGRGSKAGFLPGTGVPLAGEGAVVQPALLGWGRSFCRSPFSMEALDFCCCGVSWILGTEFSVFTIV